MSLRRRFKDPETQDRMLFLLLAAIIATPVIVPIGLPLVVSATTRTLYKTVESVPKGGVIWVDEAQSLGNWFECGPGDIAFYRHAFKQVRERGVKLVLTSTHWVPDGVMFMDMILKGYVDTKDLKYGEDWVALAWNPAFEAAQAGVVRNIHETFTTDKYGTPTSEIPMMKNIKTLKDLSLLYFSTNTEPSSWMRQWAEPAKALNIPILANLLSGSVPLIIPYVTRGFATAYINSTIGAAEYEKLLGISGMATGLIDAMSLAHLYAVILILVGIIMFQIRRARRGH